MKTAKTNFCRTSKQRPAVPKEVRALIRTGAFALLVSLLPLLTSGCGGAKSNNYQEYNDPTVIGSTTNGLLSYYYNMASCSLGLGNLVADALVYKGIDADIGLINAGAVRRRDAETATWLGPGNVTKGDITLVLPFDNPSRSNQSTIAMVSVSGTVLKQVFENAFSRMEATGGPGVSYGRFLQVSGIKVYADVSQTVGSRVTRMVLTGTGVDIDPNDATTLYRAAIPSKYIESLATAAGLSDFDEYWSIFAQGTNVVDTKAYMYDAVVEFFENFSPLSDYADPSTCSDPENRLVIQVL